MISNEAYCKDTERQPFRNQGPAIRHYNGREEKYRRCARKRQLSMWAVGSGQWAAVADSQWEGLEE
ncbi:hypothetical protein QQ045_018531 [Rhodiola kirilowii]